MTPEVYKETKTKPEVKGEVWSPHKYIRTRGYPFTHKILKVQRKKRGKKMDWWLTVNTISPLGVKVRENYESWLDELD